MECKKKKDIAAKTIKTRERKRLKKRSLKVGKNKIRAEECTQCKLIYYQQHYDVLIDYCSYLNIDFYNYLPLALLDSIIYILVFEFTYLNI